MLFWTAWLLGCSCQPDVPPQNNDDSDTDTDPMDTAPTGDTGPEPPCTVPENEPNSGVLEGNPLPLHQQACGAFDSDGDFDFWTFEVQEESWIHILVDNEALGSRATSVLTVARIEGLNPATGSYSLEESTGVSIGYRTRDIDLKYPVVPGEYTLQLHEINQQFGDKYFYDLLVTTTKLPFTFNTVEEEEGNDDKDTAQELVDGDVVYGVILDEIGEKDWYKVDVPAGKHDIIVDMDAAELGSAANFTLNWFNDTTCVNGCQRFNGITNTERDPRLHTVSQGDETLFFRPAEANDFAGPGYWYTMKIEVTASN